LGLLFAALCVAIDALLLSGVLKAVRSEQISLLTFLMGLVLLLSVPLLLVVIYQSISCLTLRYRLDRNGIVVRWAGTEEVIPIRHIQRIVPGGEISGTVVRRQGLRWPGHERGTGRLPGIGRTRFLATRPLEEQLLLVTPGQAFGISPYDLQAFLKAYEVRQELGPNRLLAQETHHVRWLTWSLWADQTAWLLLGAAVVINVGLFGYLSARYPNLDVQLPLHFNAEGMADRIGNKTELFALPIIGLLILGANLILGLILYRRERAGSYLLWGAAAAVQTLFWLATFSILP
jgi:hypothetical protein